MNAMPYNTDKNSSHLSGEYFVAAGSQNQRSVRTILLAATALAALTGCQSAAEKQRQRRRRSQVTSPIVRGFAKCRVAVDENETRVLQRYTLTTCTRTARCGRPFGSTRSKATTTQNMLLPKVASSLSAAWEAAPALLLSAAKC